MQVTELDLVPTIEVVLHTGVALDRPRDQVWPVFRDVRSWYGEYVWEIIDGPLYEEGVGLMEGQVIKVTSSHPFPRATAAVEDEAPDYFVTKKIKVTPPSEIVSVLWGSAFDWKKFTSFYIWRLLDEGRTTRVSIESLGRGELATPLPRAEYDVYEAAVIENWHRSWSTALAALKDIVEHD
jgi:hypothetical protein